jgi:hypothetical protein
MGGHALSESTQDDEQGEEGLESLIPSPDLPVPETVIPPMVKVCSGMPPVESVKIVPASLIEIDLAQLPDANEVLRSQHESK